MKIVLLLSGMLISVTAFAQSSSHFTIARSVLANGGTTFSTSSRFQLGSTIAQPLATVPSSTRFSIQSGFWILPAFEIVAAGKIGTNFVFAVETELGKSYAVQYTDSLVSPSWQTFVNFVGNGIAKTVTQSAIGVTNRFYRVIQQ